MLFGIGQEARPCKEISEIFKVSRQRVQQLEAKAMDMIRQEFYQPLRPADQPGADQPRQK